MSYAVVWREEQGPVYAGSLELRERCVVLGGSAPQARESRRELYYSEIDDVAVDGRAGARLDGRQTLVIDRRRAPNVRVASVEGAGTLHEIAERLAGAVRRAAA